MNHSPGFKPITLKQGCRSRPSFSFFLPTSRSSDSCPTSILSRCRRLLTLFTRTMRLIFALLPLLASVAGVGQRTPDLTRDTDCKTSFAPLRRQDASPSPSDATKSVDNDFPSATTVPSIPDCAEDCYGQARAQTVRLFAQYIPQFTSIRNSGTEPTRREAALTLV